MTTDRAPSRRVTVLGAAGFLGNAMVQHLCEQGHEVIACSRGENFALRPHARLRSLAGDVQDEEFLREACRGSEIVYHFASSTNPTTNLDRPEREFTDTLVPLCKLIDVAVEAGVCKLVFPSSGGTLYADDSQPRRETSPTDAKTPYAIAKLAAEQLLIYAQRRHSIATTIFRIGNPYGPGQPARPGQGVIPHWIEAITEGRSLIIYGDGTTERDYIYIDDVCRLLTVACRDLRESNLYNIGTGRGVSLNELLEALRRIVPESIHAEYRPARASDAHSVALDPSKILAEFPGWRFEALTDGLARTVAHRHALTRS